MAWEGIDQRRFPRAEYKCLLRITKNDREEVIDTFTSNIGAGGICVVLEKGINMFETVAMEICLQDEGEPVACDGTVVWVVKRHPSKEGETLKYDTGIEFSDISGEDRHRIEDLVHNILNTRA